MPPKSQRGKAAELQKSADFYHRTFFGEDFDFFQLNERIKSFTSNKFITWPFLKDCPCTPEKMAESGFYFVGTEKEPDLVRCYWCRRELSGWEPTDEPWEEHQRRSCSFIKLGRGRELKMSDYMRLEGEKQTFVQEKLKEKASAELEDKADELRQKVQSYGNSKKSKPQKKRNYR